MSVNDLTGATTTSRKPWKKPELQTLRAGAAETGSGVKGDSSGGGSIRS